MITPRFKLTQTESKVSIIIRAPYCNLRNVEVSVDEETFIFYGTPYHLRLTLPGKLVEDDCSQSSFDSDNGEFTFTFNKAIPGEHFPNLDMITKLLTPKVSVTDSNDLTRILTISTNENTIKEDLSEEFGFALAGKKNFSHVSSEFHDVFEIDPYKVKLAERRKLRLKYEQGKFNMDHYLADYIEDEEVVEVIALEPPWAKLTKEEIQFTDSELDFLKELPNTHYTLSDVQINYAFTSLIDILYAYCYDRRVTGFEGCCESGWNIIKLAASFCWLDVFKEPKDALISGFRRSVIYPLYRHFNMSLKILEDVKAILQLGEKYIIKCLIQMYYVFLEGDCCRYIINNLFIKDYIVYIMKWDSTKWSEIVNCVNSLVINKSDLGLNLAEIESDVCRKLGNLTSLNIVDGDSDDTDDIDSDSSSDSDETSSEST